MSKEDCEYEFQNIITASDFRSRADIVSTGRSDKFEVVEGGTMKSEPEKKLDHDERMLKWHEPRKRNPVFEIECGYCHKKFMQKRSNQKYCSENCRKYASMRRIYERKQT